jgi:RNA polymerase sigma-70 factor (ECF subfamily)
MALAMTRVGDLDDFGRFYAATYRHAFRTALAIVGEATLADDVTQDAYLAAFRGRGRFRGDGPAEAWLMRIVANTAITAVRRRRVRWTDPLPLDAAAGEPGSASDRPSILAALQALSPEQRAAIVLRYDRDLDYETIARMLGTSTGTVGSWLSRGLRRMARELGEDDRFDGKTEVRRVI